MLLVMTVRHANYIFCEIEIVPLPYKISIIQQIYSIHTDTQFKLYIYL